MVTCVSEGRAQTGRSKNFPAGDIRCLAVEAANKQVIALVVCLLVAWLRDVRTAAENPSSTLLHLLRPFDLWLKFVCRGPSAVRMLENIKTNLWCIFVHLKQPLDCFGIMFQVLFYDH